MSNFLKAFDSLNNGGATFNPLTGQLNCSKGYIIAFEGYEKKYSVPKTIEDFSVVVKDYLKGQVLDKINSSNRNFLGMWIFEEHLVCDIVENMLNKQSAIITGRKRKQDAIYDCENDQCIFLN